MTNLTTTSCFNRLDCSSDNWVAKGLVVSIGQNTVEQNLKEILVTGIPSESGTYIYVTSHMTPDVVSKSIAQHKQ